jgi:flagellar biosynthetic protein FliP
MFSLLLPSSTPRRPAPGQAAALPARQGPDAGDPRHPVPAPRFPFPIPLSTSHPLPSRWRHALRTTGLIGLLLWLVLLACMASPAVAQTGPLQLTAQPGPGGVTQYSVPVQTLLFFTLLSFLPAVLLMMTSFTRIIIVFGLLRMALGTQSAPPNQVLVGLALFLTLFIMGPTFDRVRDEAYQPYTEQKINADQALTAAAVPMREFMLRHTRAPDLELFTRMARLEGTKDAKGEKIERPEQVPMRVLIPAFATSELKTAFQIGFLVFLPFLIIDLVVASVLTSMGMMMVSPVLIALPFKLMLFVLADGWNLLIGSLISSFNT